MISSLMICLVGSLVFYVFGWNFKRGKLLNFIAGNTFTEPEDFKTPHQRCLGLIMSRLMYVGSAAFLVNVVKEAILLLGLKDFAAIAEIAGNVAWAVFVLMTAVTFWKSLHISR